MREPSWSLVPTAKCGLSSVAPCHHSTLSAPPPPRLVGLYWKAVCARATPQKSSIWLAIGAVRPSATILCTKARRESLPPFTFVIRPRSACSSMPGTPLRLELVRVRTVRLRQAPAEAGPVKENRFARRGQRGPMLPGKKAAALQHWAIRSAAELGQVVPHTVSSVHPSAA